MRIEISVGRAGDVEALVNLGTYRIPILSGANPRLEALRRLRTMIDGELEYEIALELARDSGKEG